jgi:hypothetical protein
MLPALLLGGFLGAAALAWSLKVAYMHGWYWIIILPALGGGALAGLLYWLVGASHCRNYWLAGSLGVTAGLVAFLGYYHLCMVQFLPAGSIGRVDLLPRYISFRLRTDAAEDVGNANVGNQPKKPFIGLNVYTFVAELLIVAGLPAGFAWKRARHAYCPELAQWMRRDVALFPPCSSARLCDALETGTLAEYLAGTPAGGDAQTSCRLILEYAAPAEGSAFDHPVYATIEDMPNPRPWYWPSRARRTMLRQVELEVAEVLTLRPLFSRMAQFLEERHTELRELPGSVLTAEAALAPVEDRAVITPVPEPFRQRVRSKGYALWVNLIGLTPLLWIAAGGGLIALGVWMIHEGISLPAAIAALVAGTPCLGWGMYMGLFCLSVAENRWIERRLRQEIGRRPDPLVDAADPEAIYVSLIPRESFAKVQLTMSSDLLLLKIDQRGRQLVLEGDSDRYRIPAGAIALCQTQCFFHPMDAQRHNQLWMVRLMIQVDDGQRELLLSIGNISWRPMTNARRQQIAEEAWERIEDLIAGRGPA